MIDFTEEEPITLRQATRILPGRRGRVNIATVWRWVTEGRRGVRLESLLIGGRRFTSRQAIQRFLERLNPVQTQQPRTPLQRQHESRRAAKRLQEVGI